jgi:N-acylneuraminate cytidylyltransferase/CMP-N,N'-diacetyllegionaminic acid synthase
MGHHPYWANILPKNGCMKNFIKKTVLNRNRQELPAFYRLNGAIDLGRCDYIKRQKNFLGSKSYAYIMPPERSVDIDNEFDFKIAEFLLINKFSESLKTNG